MCESAFFVFSAKTVHIAVFDMAEVAKRKPFAEELNLTDIGKGDNFSFFAVIGKSVILNREIHRFAKNKRV